MKSSRKLLAWSAAFLFALTSVSPANAEQWLVNQYGWPNPEGTSRVSVTEASDGGARQSQRSATNTATGDQYLCMEDFSSGNCKISSKREFNTWDILPICEAQDSQNCLVGLKATLDGIEYSAEFLGYAGSQPTPALPKLGLHAGAQVSLWSIPGLANGAGLETYAVNVATVGRYDQKEKKFVYGSLEAMVHAYQTLEDLSFEAPVLGEQKDDNSGRNRVTLSGPPDCAWSDSGKCGREVEFPEGAYFTIEARVPSTIAGWFRGRLQDPQISIDKFSETNNLVSVTAQSVIVPRFSVLATAKTTPKATQTILGYYGGNGFGLFNGSHKHVFATAGNSTWPYTVLKDLRKVAKDTSAGTSSLWNFSTVGYDGSNKCFNDTTRVLGIVTTNATVFDGTAPAFAKGFLNYKLAGMHYLPDGETESLGTYDLVMRSDIARCLYGFSKAPVSATITISGESDKSIATTVVSEKNGWLKLAAYNFTFSEKTIAVKLSQKKSTITCVSKTNTKKTKKVTGYSPKCPKGYKKK